MGVSADEYRDAMRMFSSGVTIVTVACEQQLFGMTATSFASVSLAPPLVVVCLEKNSHTLEAVAAARTFAVSVLAFDQEEVARAFARPGLKPFDRVGYAKAHNGAALIQGALAWIECNITEIVEMGDHDVVIGEVESCETAARSPLIYFDRDYRALVDLEGRSTT